MAHVLLIHSDSPTGSALATRLAAEGHETHQETSARAALAQSAGKADVILIDGSLPDKSPVDLISEFRAIDGGRPIIVLGAPTEQVAPILRKGAYYCTRSPLDLDEVAAVTERAVRANQNGGARASNGHSNGGSAANGHGHSTGLGPARPQLDDLLGNSPAIQGIKHAIRSIAAGSAANVLITGESGTGKNLVAQIIHEMTRPTGAFVALSCSTLSEAALDAELFGSAQNGHTGNGSPKIGLLEQADGGTIFLDEIDALPAGIQSKLLRFAENKSFRKVAASTDSTSNARVIAAARGDVQAGLGEGKLREDLLHRLAVVTIHLPPLRERKEDIPVLVNYYLARFGARSGKHVTRVSSAALSMLQEHSWPGNVRELCNTLERAILLLSGDTLECSHISFSPGSKPPPGRFRLPPQGIDFRELEREVVAQALELAHGNQTRAAALLHMTRDQIRYRMAKFGITDAGSVAQLALE